MRRAASVFILTILGAVSAQAQTYFSIALDGAQADGGNGTGSSFTGSGVLVLNDAEDEITISVTHDVPNAEVTNGHIHEGAAGVSGPAIFGFSNLGVSPVNESFNITPTQVATLKANGYYVNIHTNAFPAGEIRGQIVNQGVAAPLPAPWLLAGVLLLIACAGIVAVHRKRSHA